MTRAAAAFLSIAAAAAVVGFAFTAPAKASEHALSAAIPDATELARQRTRNSLNLAAKLLCSGVFVSGRDPEAFIEEDLHWYGYNFFDWDKTQWTIDREAGAVRLVNDEEGRGGRLQASALFEEGYGCALSPPRATRLPVSRPPRRRTAAAEPLPISEGGDREALEAMLDAAFSETKGAAPQRTRALLVLKDGAIVAERYAEEYNAETAFIGWSMGKSVAAILFGAFVHRAGIDIDAPAPVSAWKGASDPRRTITSRHLLNMSGGLKFLNPGIDDSLYYSDLHDHESVYFRAQDTEAFALGRPLAQTPGKAFAYRNTNTLSLLAVIREGLEGEEIVPFADEAVFSRIGAQSMALETDLYGNPIITGFVYGTARDWARLGQLVLKDGVVKGERILPEGWRDGVMLAPSPAFDAYGGQMWLNTRGAFPRAPRDAGYFLGWGRQVVMVIPSRNVVIVRLGLSDGDFDPYFDEIIAATLSALD